MSDAQAADLVVVLITGPENPKRLPSAFFLAATAAAAEQSVIMYFTGPATELLRKGKAESIFPMAGGKSVADFMKLAEDNGVRFIGCLQSLELNGMTADDVDKPIPLLTPSAALPSLGAAGRVLTW
ncbi:peroxiredoxin [Acidithiobacillus sp. 'AMD consortium']|jgi:predicted peroxiredoxin|uniref:DsrE family protein n=1 Tax=Acidithiobacillus TaxID=119977 RepID=UPI000ABDF0D7|nr:MULTISPECIES: DsrE family protein [Acidithiobacillus]MBU2773453.1 peroxiredoxin [Acidithiobacillus ferrooxidans]MBU2807470.1 peroxiredoxin [Acidithiobacillus ferrooxidans F221]MCR1345165.1 DsrE family protein [Acidithiobacillus ferrooxidans]MCR1353787.1 DsrE family protein [Acidithiobacillus ferrooxidans]QFG79029.1 peroxiredoxin [Acidithiobacillus sp. 'AMD consortium']